MTTVGYGDISSKTVAEKVRHADQFCSGEWSTSSGTGFYCG
jgi:hypothetical protein